MSALFEDKILAKGQLYRAALTFGKLIGAKDKERERIIREEVEKYRSSKGGTWNYDDLISALSMVARGFNPTSVITEFSGRTRPGEATGKVSLLKYVLENSRIIGSVEREVGSRSVDLGEGISLEIRYDVCFEAENVVYCLLIFPSGEPPKQAARKAILQEFSQPFAGMDKPHSLIFFDNLNKNGRRYPRHEIVGFEHSSPSKEFRDHLILSKRLM